MADNSAFSKALHNFTMDAACGDAIRHLTDKGYTFAQIRESLTFPAKEGYIAEVMWKQMVSKGTVLSPVPSVSPVSSATTEIIEQHDRYGRKSFLRVKKESPEEMIFSPEDYELIDICLPEHTGPVWVLKSAREQVSSLSDHILQKDRSTGSHRDT